MPAYTIYVATVEVQLFEGNVEVKFVERIVDDLNDSGLATKATDCFFDQMPETTADPCISVTDLGGVPSHTSAPQLLVQFRVRASTWEAARDKAAEIFNHYHTETDREITGYRIISALAEGLATHLGEDTQGRHTVSFNMVFRAHALVQGSSTVGFGGKRDPNEA